MTLTPTGWIPSCRACEDGTVKPYCCNGAHCSYCGHRIYGIASPGDSPVHYSDTIK